MDNKEQRRAAFIDLLRTKPMEPRMAERAYSDDKAAKLLEQLNCYQAAKGYTQHKIAGVLGIAASSLNQLLRGGYSGDEDTHLKKIEEFLDRETERAEKPSLTKFVDTSVSQDIFKVLHQNHVHGTMGGVIADSGVGKTRAFREYALRKENVILITASEWLRTQVDLSRKLAEILVVDKRSYRMQARGEAIVEKLLGASRLLIVDQAHQLTERGHQFLQNVWDQCNPTDEERRLGIVLGCTWRFWQDISAAKGNYWYEQLTSRMDAGVNKKIGKAPFKLADIKKLFSPDNLRFSLADETFDHLLNIANGKGGLRSAVANVNHLQHALVRQKAPPSTKMTVEQLEQTQALMLRRAA